MDKGLHLLKYTNVGSLFPDHPSDTIICFSKNDPVSTAFKGLIEHHILSAPVYDPAHRTHNCFVDMVDIVALFVKQFSEKELTDIKSMQDFSSMQCGKVSDLSGRNPYYPVESMAPLLTAIVKMANWGVHRIPVIDSEGQLVTVITQSHAVKFLYQNMYMFGNLAQCTVESLNMVHAPVVSVSADAKAIDAFKAMHEKRISAVAVVDQDGKLIGNISVSDLKLAGYDGSLFSRLYYPVSQFLKLVVADRDIMMEAPVTVSTQSKFGEVVSKLVNTRIHRVYLTDETTGAPVGVITQNEVLNALLDYLHVERHHEEVIF